MNELSELRGRFPRAGRLVWIGLRPARRAPLRCPSEAQALAGGGLSGDRYDGRSGKRGVTLIQAEHLAAIGSLLGGPPPDPGLLRRNLAVAGINLIALKGWRFRVGEAVLLGTGPCHPCSRMEEALGPGGWNAMRGHGGLTARVVRGGLLRVGDAVVPLGEDDEDWASLSESGLDSGSKGPSETGAPATASRGGP